jgi:glutathione S-transferase
VPTTAPISAADLALYSSETCWFCARVRQTLHELGVAIEVRDVNREPSRRAELVAGGGKVQVPCLRIEGAAGDVQWMYESADIAAYLTRRFGALKSREVEPVR